MNYHAFFPNYIKEALKNDPPGAWMPQLPKECISLSSGYPAPSLVPSEEMKKAVDNLIKEERDLPFHYQGSPRSASLQELIQKRLEKRGISISDGELLITSGAYQALDVIARTLLDQEAAVAVESPTYMEVLETFQNYTKEIITIPLDENGIQTDELEVVLKERKRNGFALPRFLYTIPSFHNPSGTTLSPERRKRLLELSKEFNFLIVEDDAYGELSFFETPLPCKAIDLDGRVLHVGSLSKVVAPGMRIGWIAGPKELISTFAWFKKDLDHSFIQAAMAVYLESVDVEERNKMLTEVYRTKCDAMVKAVEQFFPKSATWYVPKGGYFMWIKIPGVDTSRLLEKALAIGVSYIPGKYFYFNQEEGTEFLRLSFSYSDKEDIVKGVQKLGELLSNSI
ncbi:aminotransferase-like domain-containing protein [Niallia sp. 01092]|uniref:aminotransferase-like domain-containing protein n=1 Tax=unclassified Niallia TaxID=2837522 RepID=UPI003FD49ED3